MFSFYIWLVMLVCYMSEVPFVTEDRRWWWRKGGGIAQTIIDTTKRNSFWFKGEADSESERPTGARNLIWGICILYVQAPTQQMVYEARFLSMCVHRLNKQGDGPQFVCTSEFSGYHQVTTPLSVIWKWTRWVWLLVNNNVADWDWLKLRKNRLKASLINNNIHPACLL